MFVNCLQMMKESQSKDNITVRWDVGLNKKRIVYFVFPKEENELRLVPGDELRLRYLGDGIHSGWQSVGHVVRSCEHSGHALYFLVMYAYY
jgi:regulator of nonsense transcripts 1